jgi:hypothetical protein
MKAVNVLPFASERADAPSHVSIYISLLSPPFIFLTDICSRSSFTMSTSAVTVSLEDLKNGKFANHTSSQIGI